MAGFSGYQRWGLCLSIFLGFSQVTWGSAPTPKSITANINTAFGTTLNREDRQTSITLTPELTYRTQPKSLIHFATIIDRPTNPYSQFQIPVVSLSGVRELDPSGALNPQVSLSFSALSLDKLGSEGLSLRTRPAMGASLSLFSFLTLSGRLGPYLILSQYTQFTNGEPKPKYGINELISANLTVASFRAEVEVALDQAYTTFWRNNYSSTESLAYLFSDTFSLGVSHSLLSSVVDDTTGFYRRVQVFDSRQSRISMFLDVAL